jgi:hypothetical protein
MTDFRVGARVGAIAYEEGGTVYMFGYGVYEGDFVPPVVGFLGPPELVRETVLAMVCERHPEKNSEETKKFADELADRMLKNPRIKLDSGKTVWGCQCWWGPEDKIKERVMKRKVVYLDIDEEMKKFADFPPEDGNGG